MDADTTYMGMDMSRIPEHVAVIMDGNGRWARRRMQQRTEGHHEGVNSVNRITRFASDIGVRYLTLYAFSTENWNRPEDEVHILMHLIGDTIRRETPELKANNVRVHLLGDIDRLPAKVREDLLEGVRQTSECTGLHLNLCLSYSSRWELTRAARQIAEDVRAGRLRAEDIGEETIAGHLSTSGMPDPDLLIRTGGECRISNFLLWQIAYSELYFTPVLWPDFGPEQFAEAITDFQRRERRFGKTGDQLRSQSDSSLP